MKLSPLTTRPASVSIPACDSNLAVCHMVVEFAAPDCLDNCNNKKALQEADKVLKKQKDFQCAKVLPFTRVAVDKAVQKNDADKWWLWLLNAVTALLSVGFEVISLAKAGQAGGMLCRVEGSPCAESCGGGHTASDVHLLQGNEPVYVTTAVVSFQSKVHHQSRKKAGTCLMVYSFLV